MNSLTISILRKSDYNLQRPYLRKAIIASILALASMFGAVGVALAANNGQLAGSGSISGEPLIGGSITFDISVLNDPPGVGVFYQERLYNVSGVVVLPPELTLGSCTVIPSSVLQDTPAAGYTEIRFDNIKNLEVNESIGLSCSATLDPLVDIGDTFTIDYRWEAYTNPCESCTGEWRYFPGPTDTNYAPISATPQAIDIEKSGSTTTGEAQVNGAGGYEPAPAPGHGAGPDWPYNYTLTLTNNPLNSVNQVSVFDLIPPGVAYLDNDMVSCSMLGSPASSTPARTLSDGSLPNTVDGSIVLEWNLETLFGPGMVLSPGETCTFSYQTAIPYRERRFADGLIVGGGPFSGPIIGGPDASHQNNYYATGNYEHPVNGDMPQIDGSIPGATPGDDAPVSVHSSYHSITKGSSTSTVYQDTAVTYTVTGYISEYYDFTASAGTPYVITDLIPDGLEFCSTIAPGDTDGFYDECPFVTTPALFNGATLDPASVALSGDDLLITWHVTDPSAVQAGDTWTLTYRTIVRDFYRNGLPVSGLDVRPNSVDVSGEWNDLVSPPRTGTDTTGATSSIRVGEPMIDKRIWDPSTGTWVQGPVTLEIGQDLSYRIQLTFDEDLDMRNVIVDDFLPMAQRYIPSSALFDGSQGYGDTVPPFTPQAAQGQYSGTTYQVEAAQNLGNFRIDFCPYNDTLSRVDGDPSDPFLTVFENMVGGRQRLEWFLCRIDNSDTGTNIIWQVDFDSVVVDDTQVYNGCQVNNFGQLSGTNSFGTTYSLRDSLASVYAVPNLVMRKTNTAPDPLLAPGAFSYTLSVENDGGVSGAGNAYDWTIRDIIPPGLRVPTTAGSCSGFSTTALGSYECTADAGAQAGTGGFVTIRPVNGLGSHDPTRPIPPAATYDFTFQTEMTTTSPGATADEELFNTASVEYCTRPMPQDLDGDGSTDRRCEGYLADTIFHSDEGGTPTYDDFRDYVDVDDAAPNGPGEEDNTDTSRVHIVGLATDKSHIAPVHAAPQVAGDFATIGEVYQVSLEIGVPAQTILFSDPATGYAEVIDTFAHEGAVFCDAGDGIAGCVNPAITQPGALATPDTVQSPAAPDWWQEINTSPSPGSTARFFLETIDNSAGSSAYTFTITFTMVVTGQNDAGSAVFFLPAANDIVSNSFVVRYFNDNPTPEEFTTTPAGDQIDIDQPHIATNKEAVSITRPGVGVLCNSAAACNSIQVQGNDTIAYQMTYTSDGESTAFDVSMIDWLTVYATYNSDMVCTSDTAPPVGGGVVLSSPAPAPYTTELLIDTTPAGRWDLPPGNRVTCTYTITVEPTVPAGTNLGNFTDADWSTLDGATIPDERVFDDSPNDGIQDEDTEILQVIVPVAGKTRLAPGPTGPGTQPPVRIGDVVDYRITIPLPIGRTQDIVISDYLDPGLIYYEGGTLTIRTNTLNPLTYTQTLNGSNDGIGAFSVDWAVWDPACIPVVGATNCIYNDGANNTVVTVDFQAIVADVPLNLDGLVLDNDMQATFRDGLGNSGTITHGGAQDDEEVLVTEPHLSLTKSAAPATVDAGDLLTYTVAITNDGTATAYDISFDENLDDRTDYDTSYTMQCTHSVSGLLASEIDLTPFDGMPDAAATSMDTFRVAGDLTENSNGWDVAPGASITCTYRVTVLDTVVPGYTIDNIADADWSSLDGQVAGGPTGLNEREYDDSGSDATGFPAHTESDDQDTSTATVPAPTLIKDRTSGATVQPGQLVTYQIVVTVPESTISNLSITDTLPLPANAFRYEIFGSATSGWGGALPAFSVQPAAGASGILTWTFAGPITNPGDNNAANNTITLTYTVRVYSNATAGNNTNTARASYTNEAGGTSTTNTDTAVVNVIRPVNTTTKTASVATADAGNTITYTVTIRNNQAGTVAYDVYFNENLSNYTDYDTSYAMTCTHSAIGALTFEMDDLGDGFDTTPDAFAAALDQFRIAGDLTEDNNPWTLAATESIVCTYRVIVLNSVQPGGTAANAIQNTITSSFDSADGSQAGEQDFASTVSRTVTVPAPVFTSKIRTSPVVGVDDVVQPGELVSYRIVLTLPEGTTSSLRIQDALPAGFAFVSTDSVTAGWGGALPAFSAEPTEGATGTLTWTFGAGVVNPGDNLANNTITLTYMLRVTAAAVSTTTPLNNGNDAVNTGSASYDSPPAGGGQVSIGSGTARVDVLRPTLVVAKSVTPALPNRVDAGDLLDYSVTITNSGPGIAYDVYLDENLDDATGYVIPSTLVCTHSVSGALTFEIDISPFDGSPDAAVPAMDVFRIAGDLAEGDNPWTLDPGQSITCAYQAVIDQDVSASDSIANAVTGYGDTVDGDALGEDILSDGETALAQTPDASITKNNDASAAEYHATDAYAPGEPAPYEIVVSVPEGSIRDLVVCDNLPPQMSYESTTSIANSDGVTYTAGVDYTILTTGFPAVCPAGTDVAYQLASPLVLDDVPNAANPTVGGDFKTITIRSLARVLGTATDGQALTNTATLAYTRGDTGATQTDADDETINAVVVSQSTDKAITGISRGGAPLCADEASCNIVEVNPGDVLSYALTLTNTHATATAYEVTLSDDLPLHLRYDGNLACERVPGGPLATTPPAAGSDPILVDAAAIGTVNLAPGEALRCAYTATVQPGVPAGAALTNTVTGAVTTVSGTQPGEATITDTGSDTATSASIDLELVKTASDSTPYVGDTITFRLTLTNRGTSGATGVVVEDILPAGYTFVSASPIGVYDDATGLWTVGALAAGGSTQLDLTVTVDPAGPYDNYAQVDDADQSDTDSTPGDDSTTQDDDDTLVIDILPTVEVTKTANPVSLPEAGGPVTFTIEVHNTSPEPVTLTALTDSVFGNLNGQGTCATGGSIAAGATYTCTFTQTITEPPGSTHENTVTATVQDAQTNTATDTDDASVLVVDILPSILVTKTASVTTLNEPGGNVTFTVEVTNTSAEDDVLTVLTDSVFGDLNGVGTCATGGTIAAGATYTCAFTMPITGPGGTVHTDTITGTLEDDEGNSAGDDDDATVTVLEVVEVTKTANPVTVAEPGAPVLFTVQVTNTSAAPVMLTALVDDVFGDLNGIGTCATGGSIAAGATYTCTFSQTISGNAADVHTDTITATVTDGGGNPAGDDDDATVTVTDVAPTISVSKTPAPGSLNEPGGNVTFTVVVDNTSVEPVTLTGLTDSVFGNLSGQGTCALPQTIGVGGSYTCAFTGPVSGDVGDTHTNTITATANDDESNTATDEDTASIPIQDVLPSLAVAKSANPVTLNEPGGAVTFTVTVTNTSPEAVTLTTLTDSVFGDLAGVGTCATGGSIAAGATYTCTFSQTLAGNAGDTHTDTVTADIRDNEGNTAADSDDALVTFADVLPTLAVAKTANPVTLTEPGGPVTFTVQVTNTSPESVILDSLVDNVYGDLNGQGTCSAPQTIAAGAAYTCSFSQTLAGNAGDVHTDTVTADIHDDESNTASDSDDATVTIGDSTAITLDVSKTANPSTVGEPGGPVTFTVAVTNTSAEEVTLTALVDSIYGDLNGQGTCSTPQAIAVGATYSCAFSQTISGNAGDTHTNTVTASVEDDEGNPGSGSDDAIVTVSNVMPSLTVVKTANPTVLDEPGGSVTFTVEVRNTSVEPVTLNSLVDSAYGNLSGQGTCSTPQTIATGGSYTCAFTQTVSGDPGDTHTNIVTASITDDEGNPAADDDDATVTIQDVQPTIAVSKTPAPGSLPEPGGTVTFSVLVQNTSPAEPLTLTALVDDVFGDLNGQGTCSTPQSIAIGASYACSFDGAVAGNAGDTHTDTITATAGDDEGNTVSEDGSADVTITDVLPSIVVTKTAGVTSINEPGGTVSYTVDVQNTSVEPVTLTALTDDVFGDLGGQGTCSVPQTIAAGATYSCAFTGNVTGAVGGIHTNTVTGTVEDDEGNTTGDDDDADVLIADVIDVAKSPAPASLPEPGGSVTFTVVVTNLTAAPITLDTLVDNIFSDLDGQGTCSIPQTIAAGDSYTCSFTGAVPGNAGDIHIDTVTVSVTDDTGSPASDSDSASVDITDVAPTIDVTKTATPATVNEPGGSVTFTVDVENTSPEPVTLTVLTDDVFGDLSGQGTCAVPQTIAAGGTYSCDFSQTISGSAGDTHTDTITASAEDDETNATSDSDDAVVTVNPTVDLELAKTVDDAAPNIGDTITFTLTLVNNGPSTATGVEVEDLLPSGYAFDSATPSQGAYDDATGLWAVGALASGQTVTLHISVVVGPPGTYDNYAQVSATNEFDSDSTPGDDSTDEDDDAVVAVVPILGCISGALYLDTNRNGVQDTGEAPLPNVRLRLYDGATLLGEVVTDAAGAYTFPNLSPGTYSVEIDQATLPAGIPIFLTPGNPRQDVVVTVGGTCAVGDFALIIVDPAITKSGSPSQASPGDTVVFSIQVTNTSTTTAMSSVVVRDPLNGYFVFVSATTSQGSYTYNAVTHVVAFDLGTLNAGTTATMTITVRISASVPRPASINNQASVSYQNGNPLSSQVVTSSVPSLPGATVTPVPTTTPAPTTTVTATPTATTTSTGGGSSGEGPTILPETGSRPAGGWSLIPILILALLLAVVGIVLCARLMRGQSRSRLVVLGAMMLLLIGMAGAAGALLITALPAMQLTVLGPGAAPAQGNPSSALVGDDPTPIPDTIDETVGAAGTIDKQAESTAAPTDLVAPMKLATHLLIPAIEVDAPIVRASVAGKTWDISKIYDEVAYLEDTAYPGGPGNAVLAGHVTHLRGDGPFLLLNRLAAGDIIVAEGDGAAYVYRVVWTKVIDKEDIEVTHPTESPVLTLITCIQWDRASYSYKKRLVVRAELIEQHQVGAGVTAPTNYSQ